MENPNAGIYASSKASKEKHRAKHLIARTRLRAVAHSLPFSLTEAWVQSRIDVGCCEKTGIPFQLHIGNGKLHGRNPYAPSIDRRDSDLGYVPENCQLVLWMYNAAKGGWTDEDVLVMAHALVNRGGKPQNLDAV